MNDAACRVSAGGASRTRGLLFRTVSPSILHGRGCVRNFRAAEVGEEAVDAARQTAADRDRADGHPNEEDRGRDRRDPEVPSRKQERDAEQDPVKERQHRQPGESGDENPLEPGSEGRRPVGGIVRQFPADRGAAVVRGHRDRKVETALRGRALADAERKGPLLRVAVFQGQARPAVALRRVELVDALPDRAEQGVGGGDGRVIKGRLFQGVVPFLYTHVQARAYARKAVNRSCPCRSKSARRAVCNPREAWHVIRSQNGM